MCRPVSASTLILQASSRSHCRRSLARSHSTIQGLAEIKILRDAHGLASKVRNRRFISYATVSRDCTLPPP